MILISNNRELIYIISNQSKHHSEYGVSLEIFLLKNLVQ